MTECPLASALAEGLRPEERLPVSEWADRHRILPSEAAAEPGRWRTDRTPYLREIMDRLSPQDRCEQVVFIAGAQVGKTECGLNWFFSAIDCAPGPAMHVQPTVEVAKRWSKQRFETAARVMPRMRDKIRTEKQKDPDNTQMMKRFPGGFLVVTGANSAVGLRSMPVRYLHLDEVDGYPEDVDGEGDPVKLAEARTRTFSRRKILKTSTPTFASSSRIEPAFEATGRRRYHVPCPHCGFSDWLRWSNLKWEKGRPETAAYVCPHCGAVIEERHKATMLPAGRWVPEDPDAEDGKVYGYHLSSLYSPLGWYSWADAAEDWEDAQGNPDKLRVFVNTVLGETWREKGDSPDWRRIYERRESWEQGTVPDGGLILTAGADVQADRIEIEIVAWGRGLQSWSVEYLILPGDTAAPGVWEDLDSVLDRSWPTTGDVPMKLRLLGIDTGFRTQDVYAWARRHGADRVAAIKGNDTLPTLTGHPRPVDIKAGKGRAGARRGLMLWPVGVNIAKSELYGWLRLEAPVDKCEPHPRGFVHVPDRDVHWFEGLTAEEAVMKRNARGYKTYVWQKIRERNEPLDCRVYARAAAAIAGVDRWKDADWLALEESLGRQRRAVETGLPARPAKKRPKQSDYWKGRL